MSTIHYVTINYFNGVLQHSVLKVKKPHLQIQAIFWNQITGDKGFLAALGGLQHSVLKVKKPHLQIQASLI